jgi:probable HAF family extracellular repeat protein
MSALKRNVMAGVALVLVATGCTADRAFTPRSDSTRTPSAPIPAITAIVLKHPTGTLYVGSTHLIVATVTDDRSNARTDRGVTWRSSNTDVATIISTSVLAGSLKALSVGSVTITATVDAVSATFTLNVQAQPVSQFFEQAFIFTVADGVKPIPFPDSTLQSHPTAINDAGQVVGYMGRYGQPYRGFLWSQTEGVIDLGALTEPNTAGVATIPTGINASGEVTGWSTIVEGPARAFYWSKGAGMIDLGSVPGAQHVRGNGINRHGTIVGDVWMGDGPRPFVWTRATGIKLLGLPAGLPARALAINDAGVIVGVTMYPQDSYTYIDGVAWMPDGAIVNITNCVNQGFDCSALAVNQAGVVAGTDELGLGYLWSAAGGTRRLDDSFGAAPFAINDAEQVVGMRYGQNTPFFWSRQTGRIDIGLLPSKRGGIATGINNSGQVVGYNW